MRGLIGSLSIAVAFGAASPGASQAVPSAAPAPKAAAARPAATSAAQARRAAAESTTIELTGTITIADKGTYQEHPFDVPAGVTRLDFDFSYDNYRAGTELEIGVFDPQRFRGTSRFSKERFHLSEFEATPSYFPGPLVPGTWRVSLGMPAVKADSKGSWKVTVRMSFSPTPREGMAGVLKAEPGWYAGDLHAHTLHSDGFGCDDNSPVPGTGAAGTPEQAAAARARQAGARRGCQPWEVVEAARAKRLDFMAITDHNTTSHHADVATMQEGLKSLLLLRGQEMTTFRGHANVYGTSRVIDFRLGFRGRTMVDVMNDVEKNGALLSINHPGRDTGDRCTGCGWDAPQTPWDRIRMMEVVNGGVIEGRIAGMPIWYTHLNEGHHITGIGGSDEHGARSPRGRIGSPTTIVYASELSEPALLEGFRSGRVYVRTRGLDGPTLDLTATPEGGAAGAQSEPTQMGGTLGLSGSGATVRLDLRVGKAAGQRAEIVRNGEVVTTLDVPTDEASLTCSLPLAAGQWVHVRLRDTQTITAFTNPIYASAPAGASPAARTGAAPAAR